MLLLYNHCSNREYTVLVMGILSRFVAEAVINGMDEGQDKSFWLNHISYEKWHGNNTRLPNDNLVSWKVDLLAGRRPCSTYCALMLLTLLPISLPRSARHMPAC